MGIFGIKIMSWLVRCPYFRRKIIIIYKVGTQLSVLINQVSLFQMCPSREVPLYKFCRGLQGLFLVLEVFAKEGIVDRVPVLKNHFWNLSALSTALRDHSESADELTVYLFLEGFKSFTSAEFLIQVTWSVVFIFLLGQAYRKKQVFISSQPTRNSCILQHSLILLLLLTSVPVPVIL